MLTKPDRLSYGDTIGLVAPASAPRDPKDIDRGVALIEELGFKPKLAPNVFKRRGFLAGSDRDRAGDLMKMVTDSKVRAILCIRGGYGTARLLPLLDYRAIRAHSKIFIGYSDITSLHCALLVKCNLVSFHGPMLCSDFLRQGSSEFALDCFKRTLMQPQAAGQICQGYRNKTINILRGGKATGPLVGGNLSILCATLGTPIQPSFKSAVLFLEEVDEVPYRFDRMLTQLLNAGLLQQVAGIAIGINKNCKDPKRQKSGEYRQNVEDVFRERLLPLKIPIVSGLPFGHVSWNATLPLGLQVTLDGKTGDLAVMESAVN
jgi:muramoyltetrapeptide carboxypeptidase